MAQTTQGLGLQVFDFATDSTPAFVNGVAGLEDSNMHKIDEAVTNKVKIGGENVQNVNFIRNEIVQDSLISKLDKAPVNQTYTDSIYIYCCINRPVKQWDTVVTTNDYSDSDIHLSIASVTDTMMTLALYLRGGYYININNVAKPEKYIYVEFKGDIVTIKTDKSVLQKQLTKVATIRQGEKITSVFKGAIYNRPLTQNEVTHNFSVLNNSPSINKINDYVIASDTDHITDSGSILQSKINRVFYKQNCKEFSSNGEAITVNNGLDGYLLRTKLEGQTVKNYCLKQGLSTLTSAITRFCHLTNSPLDSERYIVRIRVNSVTSGITELRLLYVLKNGAEVIHTTPFKVSGTGVYEIDLNVVNLDKISNVHIPANVPAGESVNISDITIINYQDKDKVKNGSTLPFGLSSTQAVISNLGLKYSFYANEEDKLAGKVIELGKFGDVADTLEIKENGSGVHKKGVLEISLDDIIDNDYNGTNLYAGDKTSIFRIKTDVIVPSTFNHDSTTIGIDSSHFIKTHWGNGINIPSNDFESCALMRETSTNKAIIVIRCNKTNTNGTLEGFKSYYRGKGIKLIILIEPIVTTIPKELMPAILTQATNTFTFGDAVAPSKVTIQVPVNKIADFETRIAQLEKVITSTSNLSILGNYAEDEYNKEINQL